MARKLRVEYAAAVNHPMNRGPRREGVFGDDEDRQRLVATLGEACARTGWQTPLASLLCRQGEATEKHETID
jgi:hypothetical protein